MKDPRPEYVTWVNARNRCNNPNNKDYPYYGGRGITFSPQWDDFEQFYQDVGPKPSPEYTLERENNAIGYEPGNVKWVTQAEQQRNRRSTIRVMLNGKDLCLAEACRECGIDYGLVRGRLRIGWSVEEALELVGRRN